jgi:transcriptional regulator with XRE-family HTH domain
MLFDNLPLNGMNLIKVAGMVVMHQDNKIGYWPALISQIRNTMSMSQEAFAEAVFSNQATVSRWEKGLVVPTYEKQARIEKLASETNVVSLGGIVEVIRDSPHRMLLIDQNNFIIAASRTSEWEDSKTIGEQLTNSLAHKEYERISKTINKTNFWKSKGGEKLESSFNDGARLWNSVITTISIRGVVYAVVQQVVAEVKS